MKLSLEVGKYYKNEEEKITKERQEICCVSKSNNT